MARKLLIPGPVDLEDDVLDALRSIPEPHYGPEWVRLYRETIDGLRAIFQTTGAVYPLVGSGTTGLDAAIGSFLATGRRLALVRNGFFGDRLGEIAAAYGIELCPIDVPWGEAARPDIVRDALRRMGRVDALAVVHNETSTGILNPVREIAAVGREFDLPVIVDAVSSLGGIELRMDEWGVDLCVTASQKALAAPPGLALVAVGERAWAYMDANPVDHHGWYLNLRTWRHYADDWGDWHPQPVTMPTGTLRALNLRVRRILEEGLEQYIGRHAVAARRFRDGVRALGLGLLAPDADASPLVTAVEVAPRAAPAAVVATLRDRYDIWIGGGLGPLRDRIIRVGHMGRAISDEYVDATLAALAEVLPR